jgi:thiamine-phosphate pyrophosphorylase
VPGALLLCYITDRTALAADEPMRCSRLLEKIAEAASAGVDYIQLREKDLSARELESLAGEAANIIRQLRTENRELKTALLINSRADVALAAGADGVHLRSDDVSPQEVRTIWKKANVVTPSGDPLIAVSCHSREEAAQAEANGATFAVFAPVFEKKDAPNIRPAGHAMLEQIRYLKIPVLALGGVTLENAQSCLDAGAAGVAAIRLFQENDIHAIVQHLRG